MGEYGNWKSDGDIRRGEEASRKDEVGSRGEGDRGGGEGSS